MKTVVTLACLVLSLFAGQAHAQAQQKSIVETAVAAGNFDTLVAAVKAAGLVDALSTNDQLTVFAPTDEAFSKLDPALLASLLQPENKSQLASILTYHVVPGRVLAADAYGLNSAASLNGQRLNLNLRNETPSINDSSLVATDIQCRNGVIHVIDTVMLPALKTIPETAVEAGAFNTLVAAADAAGLVGVLGGKGPFTVFAPTDEAFAALPAGTVESLLKPQNKQQLINILKYHVVSGRVYDDQAVKAVAAPTLLGRTVRIGFSADGIRVNDAKVVTKNVDTSNGVIHIIDRVLLPNAAMAPSEALAMLQTAVDSGVPAFNSGNYAQCCSVYSDALKSIKESGVQGIEDFVTATVQSTMESADRVSNDTDRAWALRTGIDRLRSRLMTMSTN